MPSPDDQVMGHLARPEQLAGRVQYMTTQRTEPMAQAEVARSAAAVFDHTPKERPARFLDTP